MDSAKTIREARRRARLTLRELGRRGGTSHATIAAYESGHKTPRVDTLTRIVRAAGFEADVHLSRRADAGDERHAKARELRDVLELAGRFPARPGRRLRYPVFSRVGR